MKRIIFLCCFAYGTLTAQSESPIPCPPSVAENGIDLGEMNKILLEKIEELTLRIIELERNNKSHEKDKS